MSIKVKLFMVYILLVFSLSYAQETMNTEYATQCVEINIQDYKTYIRLNPPLDRLFRSGDSCFFLVKKEELNNLTIAGIPILSRRAIPSHGSGILKVQGDVNGRYHNYRETEQALQNLADQYPDRASLFSIGKSIEGREIYILKISDNVMTEEEEPNIYYVGCHHAREWISVEVPLLFARYLLEQFDNSPDVSRAVNGAQIYILPLLNPDGLEFTIHRYRWWRKNRRYNGNYSWGVDLNRNYGFKWGYDDSGSSPDPASEVYRGPYAFSEPETDVLQQFMLANPPSGFLTYHNYGNLIIYPWGYTNEPTPDDDELTTIAKTMSDLIYAVNGRRYEYGSGEEALYTTNGDADDWVYGTFGAPSYTIELPNDEYLLGAFFTSEEEIDLSFNENLPAMLYFVNYFVTENLNQQDKYKGKQLPPQMEMKY
jgi:murein tripeptide amidase MpaA